MTSSNFDELTKVLATSTSRRQTIKVLFASALGGMLDFGSMGTPQAEGRSGVGASSPCIVTGTCGSDKDKDPTWEYVQMRISDCKTHGGGHCDGVDTSKYQWVVGTNSSTNYVLFAGERVSGIECNKIWEPTNPNYWEFAWNAAKHYLLPQVKAGKIGLAINSKATRDRCQLHIHVSCIRPDVLKTLHGKTDIPTNPSDWTSTKAGVILPIQRTAQRTDAEFRVLRLPLGADLTYNGQNLFQLLYNNIIKSQKRLESDMQYQTLVVAQAPGKQFYIINSEDLSTGVLPNSIGAGERLLDETCKMK